MEDKKCINCPFKNSCDLYKEKMSYYKILTELKTSEETKTKKD